MTKQDHIFSQKWGVTGTKHFYWVPLFGIRSCHASFHHFSECFCICEMPTKASNGKWTFYDCHWEYHCVQKVIPVVAIPFWNLPWFTQFGKIHLEKTLLIGIHRLQGNNFTVTLKELNPHNCTNWLKRFRKLLSSQTFTFTFFPVLVTLTPQMH